MTKPKIITFISADIKIYDWSDPGIGRHLAYMSVTAVVFLILLVIIEYQLQAKARRMLKDNWPKIKRMPPRLWAVLKEIPPKIGKRMKQIKMEVQAKVQGIPSKVWSSIKSIPSKTVHMVNRLRSCNVETDPETNQQDEVDQSNASESTSGEPTRDKETSRLPPKVDSEIINIENVDDVTREKMEIQNMTEDEMKHYSLVLRNLTKYYGTVLAVNDISLKIGRYVSMFQ